MVIRKIGMGMCTPKPAHKPHQANGRCRFTNRLHQRWLHRSLFALVIVMCGAVFVPSIFGSHHLPLRAEAVVAEKCETAQEPAVLAAQRPSHEWNWTATANASFHIHLKNTTTATASITQKKSSSIAGSAVICAIAINEEAYLDEWVDYNLALGFTTIYIYDNSDRFELQDRARPGVVVRHFPGSVMQMKAYLACAQSVQEDNEKLLEEGNDQVQPVTWVAFFDVDEFLVLRQHETVVDMLIDHCPSGQLGVNWYIYYTSHELTYRPLPVTKRFQYRDAELDRHVKSIIFLDDMNMTSEPHAHFARLKQNATGMHHDTNFRRIQTPQHPGPFNPEGPTDIAVLHHYHTKSQKEYLAKKMRGRSDFPVVPDYEQFVSDSQKLGPGEVRDDSAWELLKKMVPKYQVYDFW